VAKSNLSNSDSWSLLWSHQVEKAYRKFSFPQKFQRAVLQIQKDPFNHPQIKALTGPLSGLWRYRIGDFRLLYQINAPAKQITLVYLGSRGDVY
jgi:mRNA interferase RelE/StbE